MKAWYESKHVWPPGSCCNCGFDFSLTLHRRHRCERCTNVVCGHCLDSGRFFGSIVCRKCVAIEKKLKIQTQKMKHSRKSSTQFSDEMRKSTDPSSDFGLLDCWICGFGCGSAKLSRTHLCTVCGNTTCGPCLHSGRYNVLSDVKECRRCLYNARPSVWNKKRTNGPGSDSELSIGSFEIMKVLGKGTFGQVLMARYSQTGRGSSNDNTIYAIKVLDKKGMKSKTQRRAWTERNVLIEMTHPFIAALKFAFQTPQQLFMGMEYLSGGSLYYRMYETESGLDGVPLGEPAAQFYLAEIVTALAHLHALQIVYRDMKAENVMICHEGHLRLVDFGLAKQAISTANGCSSMVGSPLYVAPEVLSSKNTKTGYGAGVDWWSCGILLHEMLLACTPFEAPSSRTQTFRNIIEKELDLPDHLPQVSRDIILAFLHRDTRQRLGSEHIGGLSNIMQHPYFTELNGGIDWVALVAKQIAPPWVPIAGVDYLDAKVLTSDPAAAVQGGCMHANAVTHTGTADPPQPPADEVGAIDVGGGARGDTGSGVDTGTQGTIAGIEEEFADFSFNNPPSLS